jgi:2-polyprenyl-3-methyl-5-hydroxy-6-metoxy-1,4-benzoquinol methylase
MIYPFLHHVMRDRHIKHKKACDHTSALYKARFSDMDIIKKNKIWQVVVRQYFQKFIEPEASVLDIACGQGEFLNHVNCKSKEGIDLNPSCRTYLNKDISFHNIDALQCDQLDRKYDVIFMSNLLEHFSCKKDVETLFMKLYPMLKSNGFIIIMGPNYRFVNGLYWDFWDHHIALTDRSLSEMLRSKGYEIQKRIPAFLPFSSKSDMPSHPLLVSLYLRFPLIWKLLGKQFLLIVKHAKSKNIPRK